MRISKEINFNPDKKYQAYSLTKITRKADPENMTKPMVPDGLEMVGVPVVFTEEYMEWMKADTDGEFAGKYVAEVQEIAEPKIGSVFMVRGPGINEWMRTSIVRSYYVHNDPENYEKHPDKLILPKDFPVEGIKYIPSLEAGDILISTMNSIYLCKKMDKLPPVNLEHFKD